MEAYARWLPQGRRDAAQARDLLSRATTDVSIARAALMMARAAEHAIQVELDAAEAAAAALRAKKAQFELDEIGARLAAGRASSGGS